MFLRCNNMAFLRGRDMGDLRSCYLHWHSLFYLSKRCLEQSQEESHISHVYWNPETFMFISLKVRNWRRIGLYWLISDAMVILAAQRITCKAVLPVQVHTTIIVSDIKPKDVFSVMQVASSVHSNGVADMVQKMLTIFASLQKWFIFSGSGNKISVLNIERAYTAINSSKEIMLNLTKSPAADQICSLNGGFVISNSSI